MIFELFHQVFIDDSLFDFKFLYLVQNGFNLLAACHSCFIISDYFSAAHLNHKSSNSDHEKFIKV